MSSSVLKQRLLTALILIPLVIWGVFTLSTPLLALVLAAPMLWAAWEWAALAGFQSNLQRGGYLVLHAIGLCAIWFCMRYEAFVALGLAVAGMWWLGVLWWLLGAGAARRDLPRWSSRAKGGTGLLILTGCWMAILWLHADERYGPAVVLFVLGLIWVADSGAYFAGRRWGRVRLAPAISPGKTREGVVGAVVVSGVFASTIGILWGLSLLGLGIFLVLSMITVVFSVVGDLFESSLKRQAGVKDSGRLLPGHGGILDRIDSLTAALPVFSLGLVITGLPL